MARGFRGPKTCRTNCQSLVTAQTEETFMKVYISCHHRDPANELAAALTAAGHSVVSTWHSEDSPRPEIGDVAAWYVKAANNLEAIATRAEAIVLVAGPDRYPGGKFVEAGYAMGLGLRVFTVGGCENGMLRNEFVMHAHDTTDLLVMLGPTRDG